MQRSALTAVAVLGIAAGAAAAPAHALRAVTATPTAPTALHDCRLRHPLGLYSLPARCGRFEVPLDHAARGGRRIALRYAIVPPIERQTAAAPLFVLAGGPGQSATDLYASAAAAFAAIHRSHAIVLLDQRGTGGSQPQDCAYPQDFTRGAAALAEITAATRSCLAKLGPDVRFYTTEEAVADLDALRRHLGYARVDLYGASYGTRVAIEYLRLHGAAVHAAILDGVVDPTQPLGPTTPLDGQRALDLIVARCAETRDCATRFADLPRDLTTLRQRFGPDTVEVSLDDPTDGEPLTVPFSRDLLAAALRLMSYDGRSAALLPLFIHEGAKGRLQPLAAQALLTVRRVEGQIAIGMQNSVVCSEDEPFFPADVDSPAVEASYLGGEQLDALRRICAIWPRGPVDPLLHAPLRSDVPTLLLAGEDDPVTPPAWARAVAAGLSRHRLLVLAGEGHGQLATGCVPKLMADFLRLEEPERIDVRCLSTHRPVPFFLAPTGPGP